MLCSRGICWLGCWLGGRALSQCAGDPLEISGDDAPADPAGQSVLAMVGTAIETIDALEHADPSLNAGPEAKALAKPALAFLVATLRRHLAGCRNGHMPNPGLLGLGLVGRRENTVVGRHQPRGLPSRARCAARLGTK